MNKIVRPVIIDGGEIMTDLHAVEIASLPIINAEQSKEIERLNNIIKPKEVNYNYLKLLFEKKDKEEVIKSYVYKCEQLEKLYKSYEEKEIEVMKKDNIIDELEWKPIDEYFKNKENYDWVLIKYYDKCNFECIPSVAEYRCGKWYLKDNDEPLQDFDVRYFFDMQQLDKLKKLKEGK